MKKKNAKRKKKNVNSLKSSTRKVMIEQGAYDGRFSPKTVENKKKKYVPPIELDDV